jgi:hypothetical protein
MADRPLGLHPSPSSSRFAGTALASAGLRCMKQSWREDILRRWGIRYTSVESLDVHEHLWTSRCSRTKNVSAGKPRDLYQSDLLEEFYSFAQLNRIRYAIVSDLHGLHLDDEVLAYYDVHPSTLSQSEKRNLGAIVGKKAMAAGYRSLVFFAHSPLMSKPYFEILGGSKLEVLFITTLRSKRA